jgi:hypothetical protein
MRKEKGLDPYLPKTCPNNAMYEYDYQPVQASQPALKLEDVTGLYLTDGALPVITTVPLSPSPSPNNLDPLQVVVFVTQSSSSPRRFIQRLSVARRMRPFPFTDDPALSPGVMAMACLAVMVTPLAVVVVSSSTSMVRIPVSLFRLLLVFPPPGPELPDQLLVGVELLLKGLDPLGRLGAAVPATTALVSQLLHQQVDFYLGNDALLGPFIITSKLN